MSRFFLYLTKNAMKKKGLSCFLFLLPLYVCMGQFQLTIQVENIKIPQGQLLLAIYDSHENYDAEKSPKHFMKQLAITTNTTRIKFEDLPAGYYAIKAFHDTNNNNKLDTNLIGLPKEQYGFSNNVTGRLGPPSFEQSRFSIQGDTVHILQLR